MSTPDLTASPIDFIFNLGHSLSDEEFLRYCALNPDFRLELTAHGELIIRSPTSTDSGAQSGEISRQVANWARVDGRGKAYDSSTGFRLPNNAIRSPDSSWVLKSRLTALPADQRGPFARLSPDLAIELRSPSDTIRSLEQKLEEYIENGTKLGILIIPETQTVVIYRPAQTPERLENPEVVSCEPEMPGLKLEMRPIFFPDA